MKGRYNGCAMNVYESIPGCGRVANIPRLSKEAKRRLKWFDYYDSHHVPEPNQALLKWENVYNAIHSDQALGYLTPQESQEHHQQDQRKERVALITWMGTRRRRCKPP